MYSNQTQNYNPIRFNQYCCLGTKDTLTSLNQRTVFEILYKVAVVYQQKYNYLCDFANDPVPNLKSLYLLANGHKKISEVYAEEYVSIPRARLSQLCQEDVDLCWNLIHTWTRFARLCNKLKTKRIQHRIYFGQQNQIKSWGIGRIQFIELTTTDNNINQLGKWNRKF